MPSNCVTSTNHPEPVQTGEVVGARIVILGARISAPSRRHCPSWGITGEAK